MHSKILTLGVAVGFRHKRDSHVFVGRQPKFIWHKYTHHAYPDWLNVIFHTPRIEEFHTLQNTPGSALPSFLNRFKTGEKTGENILRALAESDTFSCQCTHICILCIYIYIYIRIYIYVHSIYMYIICILCIYVYICISCVCVYIYRYIYTYIYVYIYVYTYICIDMCIYIYMYRYVYIYIHKYMNIHIGICI